MEDSNRKQAIVFSTALKKHGEENKQSITSSLAKTATKFGVRTSKKIGQIIMNPLPALTFYLVSALPVPGVDEQLAEDLARNIDPNFRQIRDMNPNEKAMLQRWAITEFQRMSQTNPAIKTQFEAMHYNNNQKPPITQPPLNLGKYRNPLEIRANKLNQQTALKLNPYASKLRTLRHLSAQRRRLRT